MRINLPKILPCKCKNLRNAVIGVSAAVLSTVPTTVGDVFVREASSYKILSKKIVDNKFKFYQAELRKVVKGQKYNTNLTTFSRVDAKYNGSVSDFNHNLNKAVGGNSVLKNKGEAFIRTGKKYNVNPTLLASIAIHESNAGLSKAAKDGRNNVGGIVKGGKLARYSDVELCIDDIGKVVKKRYEEGHVTVKDIAHSGKYCHKNSAKTWNSSVISIMQKF